MPDRIIGPLTMVQFIYAVIGFGLCYIIYMSSIPRFLSYIIIFPLALFVICLDFVKVQERPFIIFFVSLIEYMSAPKQRIWRQGDGTDLSVEIYHVNPQSHQTAHKYVSNEEIARFTKQYDDNDHKELINK